MRKQRVRWKMSSLPESWEEAEGRKSRSSAQVPIAIQEDSLPTVPSTDPHPVQDHQQWCGQQPELQHWASSSGQVPGSAGLRMCRPWSTWCAEPAPRSRRNPTPTGQPGSPDPKTAGSPIMGSESLWALRGLKASKTRRPMLIERQLEELCWFQTEKSSGQGKSLGVKKDMT